MPSGIDPGGQELGGNESLEGAKNPWLGSLTSLLSSFRISSPCFLVNPWHLMTSVFLLPVTAGLQGPLVSALPVVVWLQQETVININRIRPHFTVYSFGFFFSGGGGLPYWIVFPLPVTAGLFAPEVAAAPLAGTESGAVASCPL